MRKYDINTQARHVASRTLFSLLLLLSFGLFFSSIASAQQDLHVSAKVNAPLPTSPAVITSPYDQQHFTNPIITVEGTCGDGAYVMLYRNSVVAGIGACTTGNFSIIIELTSGANILQAKVYNSTDNEGPISPSITVYLDSIPAQPMPPLETSLSLLVTSVDGVPFSFGRTFSTSNHPLIRGLAPPFSNVTISFGPGVECKATASANGRWACALAPELSTGTYTVRVTSVSPQGVRSSFPAFTISVTKNMPPSTPAQGLRLMLHFPYNYHVYNVYEPWSGNLVITGGTPPYTVTVDWGDESFYSKDNINTTPLYLTHVFTNPTDYQPLIRATDQNGNAASLQIVVIVRGEAKRTASDPWIIILIGIIIVIIALELLALRAFKRRKLAKNKK
jgi:hypothetical protein